MKNKTARTILAIGAHCGDIEVTCGAVLAKHVAAGDRVVIHHLTLGEGGNPRLAPAAYGEQKRKEAMAAARALGAEVVFGPYRDGQLPNDEQVRLYVADVIRSFAPTHVITHWRKSIHRDHATTHTVAMDAILLASLEDVVTGHPRHRGIRGVFYTENWEDPEEFRPYVYVDVSEEFSRWKEAVTQYEFIRGGISTFAYLDYYEGLAKVRGAEIGTTYAVAFDVDILDKKKIVAVLP